MSYITPALRFAISVPFLILFYFACAVAWLMFGIINVTVPPWPAASWYKRHVEVEDLPDEDEDPDLPWLDIP